MRRTAGATLLAPAKGCLPWQLGGSSEQGRPRTCPRLPKRSSVADTSETVSGRAARKSTSRGCSGAHMNSSTSCEAPVTTIGHQEITIWDDTRLFHQAHQVQPETRPITVDLTLCEELSSICWAEAHALFGSWVEQQQSRPERLRRHEITVLCSMLHKATEMYERVSHKSEPSLCIGNISWASRRRPARCYSKAKLKLTNRSGHWPKSTWVGPMDNRSLGAPR